MSTDPTITSPLTRRHPGVTYRNPDGTVCPGGESCTGDCRRAESMRLEPGDRVRFNLALPAEVSEMRYPPGVVTQRYGDDLYEVRWVDLSLGITVERRADLDFVAP
jgi:hypothetical protein